MRTKLMRCSPLLAGVFAASLLFAQSGERLATPLSEARVTVSNKADANGYVRLRLTPVGGETMDTTVDILARMSENDIAADIEKQLTVLVNGMYRIDRSGGENVRIRKVDRDTTPDFVLEIAFNTPGLSISIED